MTSIGGRRAAAIALAVVLQSLALLLIEGCPPTADMLVAVFLLPAMVGVALGSVVVYKPGPTGTSPARLVGGVALGLAAAVASFVVGVLAGVSACTS